MGECRIIEKEMKREGKKKTDSDRQSGRKNDSQSRK